MSVCLLALRNKKITVTISRFLIMKSKSPLAMRNKRQQNENMDANGKSEVDLLLRAVPPLKDGFIIRQKIGEGTFSSVYLATIIDCPDKFVAIKHIIPTSHPKRVLMELDCMQKFGGKANVIEIHSCVRFGTHFVMIMPYFRHNKFTDFVGEMDVNEVREYLRNLLEALKCVHAGGVIHRDIKPSNFLYNRNSRRYSLIDFGLAQYADSFNPSALPKRLQSDTKENTLSIIKRRKSCILERRTIGSDLNLNSLSSNIIPPCNTEGSNGQPSVAWMRLVPSTRRISSQLTVRSSSSSADLNKCPLTAKCDCFSRPRVCKTCLRRPQQMAARAGTPGYRPPEVLFKHPEQTTAVDVWAVGVVFFSLLSGRYPLFDAHDDLSSLAEIISLFGTSKVREFAARIGKILTCSPEQPSQDLGDVCDKLRRRRRRISASEDCPLADHDPDRSIAYDLLRKLLELDPNDRISAADALHHPFFAL